MKRYGSVIPLTLSMYTSMDPMTQRSDSCRCVHGRSASKVPFPWLERVRLVCECDSEVQLTLVARLVHAKVQRTKQMFIPLLCTRSVQSSRALKPLLSLVQLRNVAPIYALCGAPSHALHHEVTYEIPCGVLVYSRIFFIQIGTFFMHIDTFLVIEKVLMCLCLT